MGTPSPNLYPDPSYALTRWAWETIPGVAPVTGWHDVQFSGEKMGSTFSTLQRNQITQAGEALAPLDSKIENGPFEGSKVDAFNPEADWWLLAAFFGHAAAPVTVEASGGGRPAAIRHRLSRLQTAAAFPPTFAQQIWRDDNKAERKTFGQISQIAISFAEKALIGFTPTVVFGPADFWDDAVRTAGSGTAFPVVRGSVPEQWGADLTQNLTFDVTAQNANTVTGKWKLGDGDALGGTDHVYPRGAWSQILDESDFPLGLPGRPLQAYFPLTGSFDVTDLFTVAMRRLAWSPSFPPNYAVNEALSTISVDGVDAFVKSGTLNMAAPAEAMYGYGGRDPRFTRTRGERTYGGTIAREYLDTSFLARLQSGAAFALTLVMDTGIAIGASGILTERVTFIAKNCKLTGPGPSVTDKKTLDESLTFSCHPSSDGTYPAALTAEIINSIPDLVAA